MMRKLPHEQFITLFELSLRWDVDIREILRFHLLGSLKIEVWAEEWKGRQTDASGKERIKIFLGPQDLNRALIELLLTTTEAELLLDRLHDDFGGEYLLDEPRTVSVTELIVADRERQRFERDHNLEPRKIAIDRRRRQYHELLEKNPEAVAKQHEAAIIEARELLSRIRAQKGIPFLIIDWLKHDTWTNEEALLLLSGLDPKRTVIDESENIYGETFHFIANQATLDGFEKWSDAHKLGTDECARMIKIEERWRLLNSLWNSGVHEPRNSPAYYLEWAESKGYAVPWLDWAKEHSLLSPSGIADEAPLKSRERNTFLIIIAALAKKANIDVTKTDKAGTLIEKLTDELGAHVDHHTIALKLKDIPEAIERRATK